MRFSIENNPPAESNYSVAYVGTVISDPQYNRVTERIIFRMRLRELEGEPNNSVIRMYLRSETVPLEGIEYGQVLSVSQGHIWPQSPATNPYQFDSQKWLLSEGATGMGAAKLEDISVQSNRWSLYMPFVRIRHTISDKIDVLFPRNTELIRSFVLGDKTNLDTELREAFNKAGIAHLICISGLHITAIAAALSWILSRFLSQRYAAVITVIGIFLYGLVIGFPASLVRATITFTLYQTARLLHRPTDSITRLSTAALIMLFFKPFYVYSAGFVLSFVSSAGILCLSEPLLSILHVETVESWLRKKLGRSSVSHLVGYFLRLFVTTISAQLASLPAIIAFFGMQSAISVITNLIAVPIAILSYPAILFTIALSYLWIPIARFFAVIPDCAFTLLTWFAENGAQFGGRMRIPVYPVALLILHTLLIVFASGIASIQLQKRQVAVLALLVPAVLSCIFAFLFSLPFKCIFFDAGEADASMLQVGGHTYFFDIGDGYSPLIDYTQATCPKVDAMFLSHPHYDHAGALPQLLEECKPKAIFVTNGWYSYEAVDLITEGIERAESMGIPIIEISAGDELTLSGGVTVTVLSPSDNGDYDANGVSLVLDVCYNGIDILYTGDLTQEAEPESVPDVEILKIPHHGSASSCSSQLLMSCAPELSVLSVGDNSYGHPRPETMERLSDAGTTVIRTDELGAITVRKKKENTIAVDSYNCGKEIVTCLISKN